MKPAESAAIDLALHVAQANGLPFAYVRERHVEYTWTTHGSVRGGCGHRHHTLLSAARCVVHDQRACCAGGGYSDRAIRRVLA